MLQNGIYVRLSWHITYKKVLNISQIDTVSLLLWVNAYLLFTAADGEHSL